MLREDYLPTPALNHDLDNLEHVLDNVIHHQLMNKKYSQLCVSWIALDQAE